MTTRIKVLVVDDSMLIRKILSRLINSQPDMEVIGEAVDPIEARTHLTKNPDVLTLDVEMPRMDGLTFLQKLMKLRPMPVVMVSTLTEKSAAITFKALELGAFDFVTKPKVDLAHTLDEYALEIREKVRVAAGARVQERRAPPPQWRGSRSQRRGALCHRWQADRSRRQCGDAPPPVQLSTSRR